MYTTPAGHVDYGAAAWGSAQCTTNNNLQVNVNIGSSRHGQSAAVLHADEDSQQHAPDRRLARSVLLLCGAVVLRPGQRACATRPGTRNLTTVTM